MKLQYKILIIIIPFLLLSLLTLGMWSFNEAKKNAYISSYRYLHIVLESFTTEHIIQNYHLLKEAKLDRVASYVESYKNGSINKAEDIAQERGGHIFAMDKFGKLVFCTQGDGAADLEASWNKISKELVAKNSETIVNGFLDNKPYNDIYAARYFEPWGWVVFYSVSEETILATVDKIRFITLAITLLCALVSSILIFLCCKIFLVTPIEKLKEAAIKIAAQKNIRSIGINSKDELGLLAKSMETMSESITLNKIELMKNEDSLINKHKELQESQFELKRYQDSLEQLIDERTFELKKSEERFQNAMEATKDGLYDWDLITNEIYYSPGWKRMLGYKEDELPNDFSVWEQLSNPDDVKRSWNIQQELLDKKRDRFELELKMKHKDGHWVDVLSRAKAVYNKDDKPVRIVGTHVDITRRKEVEAKLIASEKNFLERGNALRLSLDAANAGTWTWDILTDEVIWDKQMQQIFGIEPGTFNGTFDAWKERIHPDDLQDAEKATIEAMEQGERYEKEYRVKGFSGDWRIVNAQALTLVDDNGNPIRMSGLAVDVTEGRQVEIALREKHLQLQAILDHSPALISIKNMEGTVILANRNFEVLNIPPLEEFIGKNIFELFPEEVAKDLWNNDLMALETDGPIEVEETVSHKDGTEHTYLTIKFPLYDENKRAFGICAISTDITERKKLESKLLQAQKMESVGQLAGGVAHEINNPINGIMNYAQLIQDKIGEENPLSEYTSEIIHETERVSTIVKNLLVFARQEKDSHSPARIKDIIDDTMSLIQTVIKRDQITLIADISEDLPKIKCRSQQIQQVVMNLITNARDTLNEKYPGFDENKRIEVISVFFKKDGRRWIRITVEDCGLGVTPDTMERMFDPFYTTKDRSKGTGLGLSISYGIVKDHHGELSIESEPGLYTRFHMDLPVDNG